MLDIHSIDVAYGDKLVLNKLSLSVQAGEVLAVIGPNGAGKSTLVRAASGVLPVRSGSITVDGANIAQISPNRRAQLISVVPQAHTLPSAFTVYQAVLLGRTPYLGWLGQPKPSDHLHVTQALDFTHSLEFAQRTIGELSGGEQQRILLARALAQQTPVLLLDEPTTHLDMQHQTSFLNLVRKLAASQKLAVMLIVHDLNLAGLYADRIALLVQGRLQALGAPHEVLTEANLAKVYNVPVQVILHPQYGSPLVLPDGLEPEARPRMSRLYNQSKRDQP